MSGNFLNTLNIVHMDIKLILISIILIALALVGIMIKFLLQPGGKMPRGTCSYRTSDMDEGCGMCEFKNSDKCPEVNSPDMK